MQRPSYIDISAASSRAPSSAGTRSNQPSPSPRIQHYDGEVPPVLSPLDAIAAESRRLAKELEATRLAGERRMSRLPPQVITKSLSKHQANRPACFRSLSNNSTDSLPTMPQLYRQDVTPSTNNPEMNNPNQRPQSSYPRISAVPDDEDSEEEEGHEQQGMYETPREYAEGPATHYFDNRHAQSPSTIPEDDVAPFHSMRTSDKIRPISGLLPPTAPFAKHKVYTESSDDDYTSSNAGSTFSAPPRKLSNGSGLSFTTSPALQAQHGRTPSNKSDLSLNSVTKSKSSFNFSRPLSAASSHLQVESPTSIPTPWLERKPSHLSENARDANSFDDDRSIVSDGFIARPTSSYTHKKFILPRGKMSEKAAQRVSQLFAGLSGPTFGWQEPVFPGTPPLSARSEGFPHSLSSPTFRPSFDPGTPSLVPGRPNSDEAKFDEPPRRLERSQSEMPDAGFSFGFEKQRHSEDVPRPSSSRKAEELTTSISQDVRPFTAYNTSSYEHKTMPPLPPIPGSTADDMSIRFSQPTTGTQTSASTIRPTTARSQSDYQALSMDEHVDKAIELHQFGNLKESTYHLRIAAKQNHPTGMLLYALACRHGWGMRANPTEGVALLRKAVEVAMIEVTEDETVAPKPDTMEKKSHRAQFALAIYELGISHLNGWGVEKDKALALRCFEIAGSWGDADALTEAGFCYASGVGCKKNLKKAARFYRLAAGKGVSMVGNSWIYKDKYNDDDEKNDRKARSRKTSAAEVKDKKPRDKSRTRSIFGRKRGQTISEKDL